MLDWLKKQVKGVGNFLGVGPEHKLGGQRVQQTPPPRTSAPPLLTPQFRVKVSDLGQRPQISGLSQPSDTNTRFRPQLTPIKTTPTPQFVGDQAKALGESIYNLGKGLVKDPKNTTGALAQGLARYPVELGLTGLSRAMGKNQQWAVDSDIERKIFGKGDIKKYGESSKDALRGQGYSEADIAKFGTGYVLAMGALDFGPGKVVKGAKTTAGAGAQGITDIRRSGAGGTLDLRSPEVSVGNVQTNMRTPKSAEWTDGLIFDRKAPNLKAFNRNIDRFSRIGPEGQEIAKSIAKTEFEGRSGPLRNLSANYPSLFRRGRAKAEDFTEAVVSTDRKRVAGGRAGEIQRDLQGFLADASGVFKEKIPGFDVRKDYVPKSYLNDMFKNGTDLNRQAINYIAQNLTGGDGLVAKQILQRIKDKQEILRKSNDPGERLAAHVELSRNLDLPFGYRTDRRILDEYVSDGDRRIAELENYGPYDANVVRLLNDIEARDGAQARAFAQKLFDESVDRKQNSKLTQGILKLNAQTSLGTAGVSNFTQTPVNNFTIRGVRELKNQAKVVTGLSDEDWAYVQKSGQLSDSEISNIRRLGGQMNYKLSTSGSKFKRGVGKVATELPAPLMNLAEKTNRAISTLDGRDEALRWASKLQKKPDSKRAQRELRDLGLDPAVIAKQGGKLTEKQKLLASERFVERSQFRYDPSRSQHAINTEVGQVASQFRRYGMNQTAFVANEVLRPLRHGNPMPLVRYTGANLALGGPVAAGKQYISNNQYEEDEREKIASAMNAVGGLGLGNEVVNQYINLDSDKQDVSKLGGLVRGIGGVTPGKAYSLGLGAVRGLDEFAGAALRSFGNTPGKWLANEIDPPGSPKEKTKDTTVRGLEKELKKAESADGFLGMGGPTDQEREANVTRLKGQLSEAKFNAEKDPVKKEGMLRDRVRESGKAQELNNKVIWRKPNGDTETIDLSAPEKRNKISGVVENKDSVAKKLMGAWAKDGIDQAILDRNLKKLGIDTPEKREGVELDLVNDWDSGVDFENRSNYFTNRYRATKPEERDAFLEKMLKNKILTENVPKKMLELGLVTEEEANFLKNVWKNWDKYKKVWGTGKGGGSGASSGVGGKGRKAAKVSIPDVKAPAKSTIKTDVPEMTPMKANKERLAPKIGAVSAPSNRVSVKLGRPSKQRKSNKKLRFR